MSENANTALHKSPLSRGPTRTSGYDERGGQKGISRNTRLLVTKQAMAMSTADELHAGVHAMQEASPAHIPENLAISGPLPFIGAGIS